MRVNKLIERIQDQLLVYKNIIIRKIQQVSCFIKAIHKFIMLIFDLSLFTFSSHTEYVKRESIVIAWVKKKILSFWRMFMFYMS